MESRKKKRAVKEVVVEREGTRRNGERKGNGMKGAKGKVQEELQGGDRDGGRGGNKRVVVKEEEKEKGALKGRRWTSGGKERKGEGNTAEVVEEGMKEGRGKSGSSDD